MDRDLPLRSRKLAGEHGAAPSADTSPFYIPSSSQPRPAAIYAKSDRTIKSRGRTSFWESLGGGLALGKGETRVLAGLTLLGSVVRFWHLGRPGGVV